MALNLEQKKAIVEEVSHIASSALSAVAADYRGLTVSEMNELRAKAREMQVYLRVVRNTLAKRALQDTSLSCLNESLAGTVLLAFSQEEPGAAARLIKDFMKDHETLKVKALSISGQLLSAEELNKVASLPSRDEALAMLMSVMKQPIAKFVRTLAEPQAKLVRTIAAVRDKKQAA